MELCRIVGGGHGGDHDDQPAATKKNHHEFKEAKLTMHPKRKQKLILVCVMLVGVAGAAAFLLNAFKSNLQLFYSPTEVAEGAVPEGAEFKIGGLVAADTVKRVGDGLTVEFEITDNGQSIPVRYTGILPDLFSEGQGTVSVGKLDENGVFVAKKVLAKHDENYMPPEVAEALNEQKARQTTKQMKHGADTVKMQ